jgi:hypothetical protein
MCAAVLVCLKGPGKGGGGAGVITKICYGTKETPVQRPLCGLILNHSRSLLPVDVKGQTKLMTWRCESSEP